MNEEEAVRLCQGGDRDAFRLLVERHQDVLYGTAYLMTGDRSRSEDLVQEAFLSAWTNIRTFRNGRPVKPWLLRILVNKAISARRRARPEAPLEAAGSASSVRSPAEAAQRAEERESIQRALASLPVWQRQAVMLRYFADLSSAEIASVLGCREATARTRLHRALVQLREVLGPEP